MQLGLHASTHFYHMDDWACPFAMLTVHLTTTASTQRFCADIMSTWASVQKIPGLVLTLLDRDKSMFHQVLLHAEV